jgi:hypothetical protein
MLTSFGLRQLIEQTPHVLGKGLDFISIAKCSAVSSHLGIMLRPMLILSMSCAR